MTLPVRNSSVVCNSDLRSFKCDPYPPVDDQGNEVSCVAKAMFACLYCSVAHFYPDIFVYPNVGRAFAMALEESHNPRAGVSFASTARMLLQTENLSNKLKPYHIPTDLSTFSHVLANVPIAIGYQVDKDRRRFHEDGTFRVEKKFRLPSYKGPSLSGHAVSVIGINIGLQCLIARNSWGANWGANGHFLIPLADIKDTEGMTDALAFLPPNFEDTYV